MLNVYKCLSENISAAIKQQGEGVMKQPLIRSMRTVKKETLKLISGWVSRSNDPDMVSRISQNNLKAILRVPKGQGRLVGEFLKSPIG